MCKYHNRYSEWLKQKQKKKGGGSIYLQKGQEKRYLLIHFTNRGRVGFR